MLCYRLSTTLLLAATCLLMTAVVSTEKVVTCGSSGNVQRLSCEHGVIVVQTALYGRADNETCSEGRPQNQLANTQCAQKGTVDILKRRCDGKRECELNVNLVRNSNPCRGIYKYLETTFTCFPAIHFAACEGSVAHLKCDVGQIVFVYGADYGRRDRTTCSFRRPTSQIQTVDCSRPTTIVADSCNGNNSCSITVSNSVFGDPCGGTYKYLEVAYICEYPAVNPYRCDGKRECELNVNLVRNSNPCRGIYKYLETTFTCFPANVGQIVFVYGADYGRRDRTTCSFRRPTPQIQTADCSRPTTIVADSCNGNNRCSINVSNLVFGDPCGGTYKSLEVAYICESEPA